MLSPGANCFFTKLQTDNFGFLARMTSVIHQITCIFLLISLKCCTSFAFLGNPKFATIGNSFKSSERCFGFFKQTAAAATAATHGTKLQAAEHVSMYEELQIPTLLGIYLVDITPDVRRIVAASGIDSGVVTILSRHTTTAITINEMEGRLVDDTRQFLLKLVPAACKRK